MKKLYKKLDDGWHYAEAWVRERTCTLHWGKVGEQGESTETKTGMFSSAEKTIEKSLSEWRAKGYEELSEQDQHILVVTHQIEGEWGQEGDLEQRHMNEETLNECLGWTGNGHVDGGDIGMGEMSVFCIVVDPQAAKSTIINEFTAFDQLDGLSIRFRKLDDEDYETLWTPEDSIALTAPPKPPENLEEWLNETNPEALQGALNVADLDVEKCRQYAIACCMRINEYLIHPDSQSMLKYAEQFRHGEADLALKEQIDSAANEALGNAAMMDYLETGDMESIREMEGDVKAIQAMCDLAEPYQGMDSIVFSHAADAVSRLLSSDPEELLFAQQSAAWAVRDDQTERTEESEKEAQADLFRGIFPSPFSK